MSNLSGVFLGIDTSNYTTSVAVCDSEGNVLANLKKLLPVKEGERGLRQSDAVFHHTVQLPPLMEEARKYIEGREILAVGVSSRPTDKEGSYMPCFLAGVSAAGGVVLGSGAKTYSFSHQCGHIMAALYSSESLHLIGKAELFKMSSRRKRQTHINARPVDCLTCVYIKRSADSLNLKGALTRAGCTKENISCASGNVEGRKGLANKVK